MIQAATRRRHGEIYIPGETERPGLRSYFVCGFNDIRRLTEANISGLRVFLVDQNVGHLVQAAHAIQGEG